MKWAGNFLRIFAIKFASLSFALTCPAFAQDPPPSKKVRVQVPEEYRGKGRKLRIRNLESGKEVILDSADEEFIASEQVASLIDPANPAFVPEVSVLEVTMQTRKIDFPNGVGHYQSRSLVFDQPVWRRLGAKVVQDSRGLVLRVLDVTIDRQLTPLEAERRRSLQEGRALKRLFQIGWEALGKRRYDLGLEAFDRILKRRNLLNDAQKAQAHLGRGIALFHQKGCAAVDEDLREADRGADNRDDVSYYRGLCLVEQKKFKEAGGLFQSLLDKQNTRYADQSRFYLGIVAENESRWNEAETYYLDTIDFASDASIVNLAKQRLEVVRAARTAANYQHKIFSLGLITGLGYDTNVVALPQGLAPSDFNVTDEASSALTAIGFFEVKPPWGDRVDHRMRLTAVGIHYGNASVASLSDLQTYDFTTTFAWNASEKNTYAIGANYTSVFKGPLGSSAEYVTVPGGEFKWYRILGDAAAPTGDMETSVKYLKTVAKQIPEDATQNPAANAYLLSWRWNVRQPTPHVHGPGADLEFHPAAGTEISYYALTGLYRWDFPAWPRRGVMLSQEASLGYSAYYQSEAARKDYLIKYTGSLAKSWTSWFETRLQLTGTLAFSTEKSVAQYQKLQANFLMSLVY